jgi:Recombination endonuclease VII
MQPSLFEWTPTRSGCRRLRLIRPRPLSSDTSATTANWETRRMFWALWKIASKGDWLSWRFLLTAGERYMESKRKRRAEGVLQSYRRHIEQRRAASRAERQRNREKWRAYQVEYNKRNRDRLTASAARWRQQNADRNLDNHLRRSYGLTLDEYRRLLIAQGGGCRICGTREGHATKRGRLHVDHDHVNGEVRGLLCGKCNRGIGQLMHSPHLCRIAADYLESKRIAVGCIDEEERTDLWDVSVA